LHPYFSPCEIADGLVSCNSFVFNRNEYTETLTLAEIIGDYLHKRHKVSKRIPEENILHATTLDVLAVSHIETSQDRSVFVVYSIFQESEEEDRSSIHALSMVLSPSAKILRECELPEERIFI
jgi:hypothetical protein